MEKKSVVKFIWDGKEIVQTEVKDFLNEVGSKKYITFYSILPDVERDKIIREGNILVALCGGYSVYKD